MLWKPPRNYFDTSNDQQSAQLQQVSEIWSHDHPVEQKEQKDGASEDCPLGDTFRRTQKMFYLFCQRTATALWASGQQCVCGTDKFCFVETLCNETLADFTPKKGFEHHNKGFNEEQPTLQYDLLLLVVPNVQCGCSLNPRRGCGKNKTQSELFSGFSSRFLSYSHQRSCEDTRSSTEVGVLMPGIGVLMPCPDPRSPICSEKVQSILHI